MSRDPLARVRHQPDPASWADDDKLTLKEAVALFYPRGPVTLKTLRSAIAKGGLIPYDFAGKLWVTPAQMRALFRPRECPEPPKVRASISGKGASTRAPESRSPTSGTSETDRLTAAQDALRASLAPPSKPSPNTSSKSARLGPRSRPRSIPTARVIPLRSSQPRF